MGDITIVTYGCLKQLIAGGPHLLDHPPVQAVYTAWTALMEGHDLAVPPLGEFAAWAPQPAQVMTAWPHGPMAEAIQVLSPQRPALGEVARPK